MKTFFAVLAAILCAAAIIGGVVWWHQRWTQWHEDVNKDWAFIKASERHDEEIGDAAHGGNLATLAAAIHALQRSREDRREMAFALLALYDRKPTALTPKELEDRAFAEEIAAPDPETSPTPAPAAVETPITNQAPDVVKVPSETIETPAQTVTPTLVATPTPTPDAALVQASKRRAAFKYPALAVAHSPFNAKFLSRLSAWQARADDRLNSPQWPELLADDCAMNTVDQPPQRNAQDLGSIPWRTPRPTYPFQARAAHLQGVSTVRVTTDGGGRVVNVVITKSTGSGILDNATTSWVRSNWSGPPNSTRVQDVEYRMSDDIAAHP